MSVLYSDLTETTFPEAIDNLSRMMNITAEDLPFINLFHYYLRNGDFQSAEALIDEVPDADKKMIDSTKLNKMRDALIALERFYLTDVQPYIAIKQGEWQDIMDEFTFKGTWSSSNTYIKNNIVSYTMGGKLFLFIAVQDVPVGAQILNTDYWIVFTAEGSMGVSGNSGAFMFGWNLLQTYIVGDIVTYDNKMWEAITINTGSEPSMESTDWNKILDLPSVSAPLQAEAPIVETGELWFEIV